MVSGTTRTTAAALCYTVLLLFSFMLISRKGMVQIITAILPGIGMTNNGNQDPLPVAKYYKPPPNHSIDYSINPTPFGRILEGSLPAYTYRETENTLTFRDRTPKAPLHALVIPKTFIPSIQQLTPEDLGLLYEMKREALETILNYSLLSSDQGTDISMNTRGESILEKGDYILCFHIPPFNSVDHLHLHVLAPKSEMKWIFRHAKYLTGTPWCADLENVISLLEKGGKKISR